MLQVSDEPLTIDVINAERIRLEKGANWKLVRLLLVLIILPALNYFGNEDVIFAITYLFALAALIYVSVEYNLLAGVFVALAVESFYTGLVYDVLIFHAIFLALIGHFSQGWAKDYLAITDQVELFNPSLDYEGIAQLREQDEAADKYIEKVLNQGREVTGFEQAHFQQKIESNKVQNLRDRAYSSKKEAQTAD